jgi:hypothetical protein
MFESLLPWIFWRESYGNSAVTGLVATVRTRPEEAAAEVAKERAMGLVEVAQERADLHREIEAMQAHQLPSKAGRTRRA